jgi:hypothetical protein
LSLRLEFLGFRLAPVVGIALKWLLGPWRKS